MIKYCKVSNLWIKISFVIDAQLSVNICSVQISMTSPRSFQRSQIAIPGSGLKEIGSTLKEIVEEYGKDYQGEYKLAEQNKVMVKFPRFELSV